MTGLTSPTLGPARAFDLAKRDLQAIADRHETMHTECWWPKQPDRDRPTPTLPPGLDVDTVPGPTWDCGQGDHQIRQGWERMVCHLYAAELAQAEVLAALLERETPHVRRCRPTSLLDAQHCVERLTKRLSASQGFHDSMADDVPRQMWLARQLMGPRGNPAGSCFDHIKCAMYEAQRAVPIVGNGKPPPPCTKCRRIGSVGQPRKGGLCHACYQARYRLERRQRQAKVRAHREDAA